MSRKNKYFDVRLNYLHQKHKLDHVLNKFRYEMTPEKFIGYGGDATAFKIDNSNVLKLCVKTIGYFQNHPRRKPSHLKKIADKLQPYLLPMTEILYDNKDVFVYTQPLCSQFKRQLMTHKHLHEIYEIEWKLMVNKITTSTSSHNLAYYQDRVVIFDYHDLHKFKINKGQLEINHNPWLAVLLHHLIKFTLTIYDPKHLNLCDFSSSNQLIAVVNNPLLPTYFQNLVRFFINDEERLHHETLCNLLHKCVIGSL